MQLGLENKKKAIWAAALGGLALLAVVYEVVPLFMSPSSTPASSAQAAPSPSRVTARSGGKAAKKVKVENLDPTLRLDLLAASEQTQYEGNGRNIFVSQAEVNIPQPLAPGSPDAEKKAEEEAKYTPPGIQPPPPIPLKFFGFASKAGEPKKIFLLSGDDVFVAAEGEIVDRRYKVVRITPTAVEIQDVVNSGPSQSIPLTQG